MPKCPEKITVVPVSELFSFDFITNMNGTETININYTTKPMSFSKSFNYDILQMNTANKGINNPISKHWPLIETWKTINTTKIQY